MSADSDMNPLFQVEVKMEDKKRHYFLKLSRANLNYFLAGCPDIDRLVGTNNGNTYFNILPNPLGESSKEILPNNIHGDYFIQIGAPVPQIPFKCTDEQFNKLAAERDANLEQAIRNFKRIPIIDTIGQKPFTFGYVTILLE